MTEETMTVHEALAELKTLDARIRKAVTDAVFVTTNKHANDKIDGVPINEYKDRMKSGYQKAVDLIRRRDAIKRAVVLSNANTTVEIAGKSYTVAEAIDAKQHSMEFQRALSSAMSKALIRANAFISAENGERLEIRANEYTKNLYGNSDMSKLSEAAKRDREEFINAQTIELVDPINVSAKVESLDTEIFNFEVKVDAALSVSNATTKITINY